MSYERFLREEAEPYLEEFLAYCKKRVRELSGGEKVPVPKFEVAFDIDLMAFYYPEGKIELGAGFPILWGKAPEIGKVLTEYDLHHEFFHHLFRLKLRGKVPFHREEELAEEYGLRKAMLLPGEKERILAEAFALIRKNYLEWRKR